MRVQVFAARATRVPSLLDTSVEVARMNQFNWGMTLRATLERTHTDPVTVWPAVRFGELESSGETTMLPDAVPVEMVPRKNAEPWKPPEVSRVLFTAPPPVMEKKFQPAVSVSNDGLVTRFVRTVTVPAVTVSKEGLVARFVAAEIEAAERWWSDRL